MGWYPNVGAIGQNLHDFTKIAANTLHHEAENIACGPCFVFNLLPLLRETMAFREYFQSRLERQVKLNDIELHVVSGGDLYIDGGTMFGPVPKAVWQGIAPADGTNRIAHATNCLLVKTPSYIAVIDTGYGTKVSLKQRDFYSLTITNPLLPSLATLGVKPEDVDFVILTHLHFDHAGGCTFRDAKGRLRPVFPRAKHVVQSAEWEDANGNLPELEGSYFPDDFRLLQIEGLLQLVDGSLPITEHISVELTGGHTRGHQIARIASRDNIAIYLADLCPFVSHLRVLWTMAYDQFPLDVRRAKFRLLAEATNNKCLVFFDHDPMIAAAYICRKSGNKFEIEQPVAVSVQP